MSQFNDLTFSRSIVLIFFIFASHDFLIFLLCFMWLSHGVRKKTHNNVTYVISWLQLRVEISLSKLYYLRQTIIIVVVNSSKSNLLLLHTTILLTGCCCLNKTCEMAINRQTMMMSQHNNIYFVFAFHIALSNYSTLSLVR